MLAWLKREAAWGWRACAIVSSLVVEKDDGVSEWWQLEEAGEERGERRYTGC